MRFWIAVAAAAAVAGCSPREGDTAAGRRDTGMGGVDTALAPIDTARVPIDTTMDTLRMRDTTPMQPGDTTRMQPSAGDTAPRR